MFSNKVNVCFSERFVWVPVVILSFLIASHGFSSLAASSPGEPPIPKRDFYSTQEGTEITITLSATDEDIDPMRPGRHPISFELLDKPLYGELTGNIKNVHYESPHRAYVELQYIPNEGFRGMETLTYSVEDETGNFNISMITIDVLSKTRPPISLAGDLKFSATLREGEPNLFSGSSTDLTTVYNYGDLELKTDLQWSLTEWSSLKFETEMPLGAMEIESKLDFQPQEGEPFNYWRTTADFDFSEMDIEYTFNLDRDSEDIYHELETRWNLDDVSFRSKTKFSGANPQFDESTLRTRWNCQECDVTVNTDLNFTEDGFEELAVDVGDIPLLYGTYFEFETTFTSTSKEVEPNLFYKTEWVDCFKILAELVTNEEANKLEGVSIYGLRFRNTFTNGLDLRADFSLIDSKNSSVTGNSDFSNKLRLSGPFYAGYRAPGRWQITNYLGSVDQDKLFGWGETKLKVVAPLSENLEMETELLYRKDSPAWELTLGGEISW